MGWIYVLVLIITFKYNIMSWVDIIKWVRVYICIGRTDLYIIIILGIGFIMNTLFIWFYIFSLISSNHFGFGIGFSLSITLDWFNQN